MHKYSSKFLLVLGFGFVVLIIATLTIVWTVNVVETQRNIEGIYVEQKQSRLVVEMRDAARRRALLLHRMGMLEDVFDRDEVYLKFKEMAGKFIIAREELLSLEKQAGKELAIWNKAVPQIRNGEAAQRKVAELFLAEEDELANHLLLNEVIPIQNKANATLSEMFEVQKEIAYEQYQAAITRNQDLFVSAIILGVVAVLLTIIAAMVVIRRTVKVEASLEQSTREAQSATEQKSQFLANMSHEIRSPLTAVLGFADSLLDSSLTAMQRAGSINRIICNGQHLLQVINDILDFSKIEANQLTIENIDVSPVRLVRDVERLIGDRVLEKGLKLNTQFEFPIPEYIVSDPTRIKQILVNLVANSIKFTEQGQITICTKYNAATDSIIFQVKDTGIGMTEEQQAGLYRAFNQADVSTTRKFGGTGLGLTISKQLAQMLGGDLDCTSKYEIGSIFTATIKTKFSGPPKWVNSLEEVKFDFISQKIAIIPALKGRVLLAEDGVDNQVLISMYVKKTGATIDVVENGRLALGKVLMKDYDLILMDMQMPVMGGEEAITRIREAGNQTPIAMLTANAILKERDKCLKLGANEFLTKPIDKEKFFSTLAQYLSPATEENANDEEQELLDDFSDMQDLIDKFVAKLPAYLDEIQQAMGDKDWSIFRPLVHSLKGVGGSFGFPRITELCRIIEKQHNASNISGVDISVAELMEYCNDAIVDYRAKHPASMNEIEDVSKDKIIGHVKNGIVDK